MFRSTCCNVFDSCFESLENRSSERGDENVVFSPPREQKMHCLNDKAKKGRGKENVSTAR